MQRLENLEITKVAFVPEGDNKRADVLLFKSKPEEKKPVEKSDDATIAVTEKEANVIKRVLLAIGKALGFTEDESATPPAGDPTAEDQQPAAPDNNPAGGDTGDQTNKSKKGVDTDMKIDKSKLTPEELAQLEAIEKKAGVQEDDNTPAADDVNKGTEKKDDAQSTEKAAPAASDSEGGEDIYKGLHPAVAAELKELRKRADAAEERELTEVAKKYEILGKKPEELAKTLKTLKAAGGTAYDDMIGVLDASLASVEKSGAFNEVGKSRSGQPDAWDQIEKHADDIMKAAPTMTRAQAIEKACEQHPDLVAEYEQNR